MAEQQKTSTATNDQAKDNTSQQTTQQQQQQQKVTTEKKKKSSRTEASISKPAKKAEPVLTCAEIDRMIDLGLGRGIDSTDCMPWTNKGAFQVRRVTAESVIGTEEGGALQRYECEVSSVTMHQTDLKTSVAVPQAPVQVGIDAEQSRTVSSTRRTVGKKSRQSQHFVHQRLRRRPIRVDFCRVGFALSPQQHHRFGVERCERAERLLQFRGTTQ